MTFSTAACRAQMLSNEALRDIARFGTPMSEIPSRYRWDAIEARRELEARDYAAGRAH